MVSVACTSPVWKPAHLLLHADINQICLGSGASDILDLIIRVTCVPSRDKILIAPPTFELYRVCAAIHDVGVHECRQELTSQGDFDLPLEQICESLAADQAIKVVFLPSPGNPTGTLIPHSKLRRILDLKGESGNCRIPQIS